MKPETENALGGEGIVGEVMGSSDIAEQAVLGSDNTISAVTALSEGVFGTEGKGTGSIR